MHTFGASRQDRNFLDPHAIVSQLGFVTPGMMMADFGCGGGYFTLALAEALGDSGKVYAVDIMQEALDVVKEKAQARGLMAVETVRANLEARGGTGIRDNSLDIVWMVNVLFQNQTKDGLFAEAYRALKPEGMLIVIDWIPNMPIGPDGHRVTQDEVAQLAGRAGFQFYQNVQAGQYHHGSVFMKKAAR